MVSLALLITTQMACRPAAIFSDGMVLQRGKPIPVFGFAPPGSTVSVEFNGQRVSTVTEPEGRWALNLRAVDKPGPHILTVRGTSKTVVRNVLVGEVWLCAGQSNMDWPVLRADQAKEMLADSNADIRFFKAQRISRPSMAVDVKGSWTSGSSETMSSVSAVGLAFALRLRSELGVPVGIVQATWGGSRCESWMSQKAIDSDPALRPIMDEYFAQLTTFESRMVTYRTQLTEWEAATQKIDPGNKGFEEGWARVDLDEADWFPVDLPASIEQIDGRDVDGAFWFRKTIDVPAAVAEKGLRLALGQIADNDTVYFNNSKVGGLKGKERRRAYFVGAGLVQPGKNVISIRCWNRSGDGGVLGPICTLEQASSQWKLDLAGTWLMKSEVLLEPAEADVTRPVRPMGPGDPNAPAGAYHGMIGPLMPMAIRGVLWYQGEAHLGEHGIYRKLFPALINDWRRRWKQPNLPFYFVQLPGYGPLDKQTDKYLWAEMREAQTAALSLPATGMAVTYDLGEQASTHPRKKRQVGDRLAAIALDRIYDKPKTGYSPRFKSYNIVGDSIRLRFDFVAGGFNTFENAPIRGFEVLDTRGVWHPGRAVFDGIEIVVTAEGVPNPLSVRYAYHDFPDGNVTNGVGLPLQPFWVDRPRQDSF